MSNYGQTKCDYFVCIFNFDKKFHIDKVSLEDKTDINYLIKQNPEETIFDTYFIYTKIIFSTNNFEMKIKLECHDNYNEKYTFESNKIQFEKNKSLFLYEINFSLKVLFMKTTVQINQKNHYFFKLKNFLKFIEEKENDNNLRNSLIDDSIQNFKKLINNKEKTPKQELEFFYLLLLMKVSNNQINFSFEEFKTIRFIFPSDISNIENIDDYKNYLLDDNFKNNDDNYKIIKFIFLWKYFKDDFINELIKENFEKNFLIFINNLNYFYKINSNEKINNLNKILYKCNIHKLNGLLKLFVNINDQIAFITNEKDFINKNFQGKKIIFNKNSYINLINKENTKNLLIKFLSLLNDFPTIQFEIMEDLNEYDFLKESFKLNQYNISFIIDIRNILKEIIKISNDIKYKNYYVKCLKITHDNIKNRIRFSDPGKFNIENILKYINEDIENNNYMDDNFYNSKD